MKTLQLQTRADIQGNQNQVQACATKIAGFDILQLLIEKRKSTGFKSLQVNCWEINQVKSKCQMDTLDKSCETGQTKKKNEHQHQILHIRIGPGTKFQLKLTILTFQTKLT